VTGQDRLAQAFLELLGHSSAVLMDDVSKKHPQFFVGFNSRTRKPVFSFDPKLARKFHLHDKQLLDSFVSHLRTHGHVVRQHPHHSGHAYAGHKD
jgi:hypothetical protein